MPFVSSAREVVELGGPLDVRTHADHLFDLGVVLDLEDVRNEIGQRDDGFGPAVAEHVADLSSLVLGIHRNDDPPARRVP